MYKAVFIDLDGTLLKTDHSVGEATTRIICKLKEKNILIVLVSARPLHGILPISKEIGLLDFPIASLNGAYIASGDTIIYESFIDHSTTAGLYKQLQQYDVTIIYYQQMKWFAEVRNAYTDAEQIITPVLLRIQPFSDTIQYWQKENAGPNKMLVITEPTTVNEIQNTLRAQFGNRLNISTSKPDYLEIMNEDASKINAVKFLIKRYGINREDIIAIGDNFNDKDMIEFAGTGIAMGNAPDEVKAIADYVTDTNDNDGVAKGLIKFMGS